MPLQPTSPQIPCHRDWGLKTYNLAVIKVHLKVLLAFFIFIYFLAASPCFSRMRMSGFSIEAGISVASTQLMPITLLRILLETLFEPFLEYVNRCYDE